MTAGAGWVVIAATLELTAREVARRPLFPSVLDGWSSLAQVLLASASPAVVFFTAPRRVLKVD